MPSLELSSGIMHYDVVGSGEPLLLVPGFASGAWSWAWQTPDLSRHFEVITFDPIGVSRSTLRDRAQVSIEGIADDLGHLVRQLGIRQAHVLGISFGGFVAQTFALKHPSLTRRLVLASTSFGGPNHVAPAPSVLAAFAPVDDLNAAARIRKYITLAFIPEYARTHQDVVESFCRMREENHVAREVYVQQLSAALTFNTEEMVPLIKADTLVITGEDDAVVPAANSRNLAARIPGARLEVIPGTGHMAFVEKAGEFNRLVTAFLKRSSEGEVE